MSLLLLTILLTIPHSTSNTVKEATHTLIWTDYLMQVRYSFRPLFVYDKMNVFI